MVVMVARWVSWGFRARVWMCLVVVDRCFSQYVRVEGDFSSKRKKTESVGRRRIAEQRSIKPQALWGNIRCFYKILCPSVPRIGRESGYHRRILSLSSYCYVQG